MALREIEDRSDLKKTLSYDRSGCAYQLAYLDDAYGDWTRLWGVFDDTTGEVDLLLLMYHGLSEPIVLSLGNKSLLEQALAELYPTVPSHFYCQLEHDHLSELESRYELGGVHLSLRLALNREQHQPMEDDPHVARLGPKDIAQIMRLFKYLPDVLFEPFQLDSGYFFGLFDQAGGRLISVSGVQALSPKHGIAVLGPIVTHPSVRRLGLASRVLSRQLNELFQVVDVVTVQVPEANEGAQGLFLGHLFEPYRYYWEGLLRLRY
ncbi:MAG: hypothetical protein JW797_17760 [Bradymonadales bacterium]|nr:hypothetical protein [Bradymonadales bacterium]